MGRRERKNEKRKQVVMSIVLSVLMVMSLAGIFIGSSNTPADSENVQSQDSEYNGYKFTQLNTGQFSTRIDGTERKFYYHPLSTLGLQIPQEALYDLHQAGMIIFTFNPESPDIQAIEVARFEMGTYLDKNVMSALTKNSSQYPFPVVTCESAQPATPIIQYQQSNNTQVIYNNGCITINAAGPEVIRVSERIIYDLLGVIQ